MLVKPLPGVRRADVRDALTTVRSNLEPMVLANGTRNPHAYFTWAARSAYQMHGVLDRSEIDRLVLTDGYDRLLAAHDSGRGTALHDMLDLEVHHRFHDLTEAVKSLNRQIDLWTGSQRFLAFDTNVYLHHPVKVEELDFGALAPEPAQDPWTGFAEPHDASKPVRLLVPMVVVDELDNLKRSKDKQQRWRAAYTLAVLDRVLPDPRSPGVLRPAGYDAPDGGRRGEVTVEVLLDPPRHVRLPIADDEIVDQVKSVEPLAGRPIKLVTYDTGCMIRARAAGLCAEKLVEPKEDEPAPR